MAESAGLVGGSAHDLGGDERPYGAGLGEQIARRGVEGAGYGEDPVEEDAAAHRPAGRRPAWRLASVGWVSGDAHSVRDKFGYHPIGFVRRHDRFDPRAGFSGRPES